jgi:carboxypeptidase T
MLNRTKIACGLLALAALVPARAQQTGGSRPLYHLAVVDIASAADLDRLLALDLDLAACQALELGTRTADVIAHGDQDLARLQAAGLPFQVAIRDMEAHYAQELARFGPFQAETLTPPVGQGAMGGHYTLAQMEAILDGFAQSYPGLCSPKTSIGTSLQGRDIWVVKISDNVAQNENEARAYFDAVHHAREPVSMTATLDFMDWLLSSHGSDPDATFLVDERELYFVPCVNPDGYEFNRQNSPGGGGMWRKNRRANADGTTGVDLNRNYATGWSAPNGGNSTSGSSDTYRGTSPFSEPESAAIEAFMTGMGFSQSCSTHTYTDVLLHPWGYVTGGPANAADYAAMGPRLVDDSGVPFGPVSTQLYIAAGGALDHHHAVHGTIAWSPELGRANEGGFWPNSPTQVVIVDRHRTMFRDMALTAGALIGVGAVDIAEDTGGNGDGAVGPGETGKAVITVENAGLAAPIGAVTVQLTSLTAGVTVLNGSTSVAGPGRLGSIATTLRFQVSPGFQGGSATVRVTVSGDGRTTTTDETFRTEPLRLLVADDMERDRGFAASAGDTATTGRFDRSAPQATTYNGATIQQGADHSPNGTLCHVTDGRAGTSVGQYDVDGGYTDLLSPVVDLAHVSYAELRFWRFYAESVGNDAFEVAVSLDGGTTWTTVLQSAQNTNGWVQESIVLPTPLTNAMRFRFRAQDLNASLVEAGIDDVEIHGVGPNAGLVALSSGALGSTAGLGVSGAAGATSFVLFAPAAGGPTSIPGVLGSLLLDTASLSVAASVTLSADGAGQFDLTIPSIPGLAGATARFQVLEVSATSLTLGNLQALTLR